MTSFMKRCVTVFLSLMFVSTMANAAVTFSIQPGNDSLSEVIGLLDDAPDDLEQIGRFNVGEGFEGAPFEISFDSGLSGSWHIEGFDVFAVVIKGGPDYLLVDYSSMGPVDWDNWCTDASCFISGVTAPTLLPLLVGSGNNPALSHLTLYGTRSVSTVPEPATWLMMILGFGLSGLVLRRRYAVA
ncbi:PEPxxWA-CTERM sorting domain-containing protein [Kordiimonas sp. SCSIO 12610]|uniref:PEPxxWA-CTERM sorting domain-containing protein n=1 Tax=Kordiimonas sp. SCSIO 12610 TaxID=2829597 RepID=UPI00210C4758|nr:PEPxxWA-CTERM sorting domain-containing protein [Kordiimonas sp. SCSIO 12610]UTW55123.1 PEP-CTERM sorting domain-containing protein [Kordiimonas sp. SCSIO 12610]